MGFRSTSVSRIDYGERSDYAARFNVPNYGTDGDDVLYALLTDTVFGGGGNDVIYGSGGDDHLAGQDGNDIIAGGDGNDELSGGSGNDVLSGNDGNDILVGGTGEDVLYGNDGSDMLWGGADADRFKFWSDDTGVDRIKDFDLAEDTIALYKSGGDDLYSDFGQILQAGHDTADGWALNTGSGWVILEGITEAQLSANDFYLT